MKIRSDWDIYDSECRKRYNDDMPTDYERCRELEKFFENYSWIKLSSVTYTYPSSSRVFLEKGHYNRFPARFDLKKMADDEKLYSDYLETFIKQLDSPEKISETYENKEFVCRYEQSEPDRRNLPLPIYVNLLHAILRKTDVVQMTEYNVTDDEDEDCNCPRFENVREEISYQKARISAAKQLAEIGTPEYDIENYMPFFKNWY